MQHLRIALILCLPIILTGLTNTYAGSTEPLRSRTGTIDSSLFTAFISKDPAIKKTNSDAQTIAAFNAENIIIKLFADTQYPINIHRIKRRGPQQFTLFGKVTGKPFSTVVFRYNNGQIYSHIDAVNNIYSIKQKNTQQQIITQHNRQHYNQRNDVIIPKNTLKKKINSPASANKINQQRRIRSQSAQTLAASQIDIMVLYNQAVLDEFEQQTGHTRFANEIGLYIDVVNETFANSEVNAELNLVHSALIDYVEDTTQCNGLSKYLSELTDPEDTIIDDIHQLRDSHGADLVNLLVKESCNNALGLAYGGYPISYHNKIYAFSVVVRSSIPYYSLAHELGHNLSAMHEQYQFKLEYDASNDIPLSEFTGFNYGYVNMAENYMSIMAYGTECIANGFYCYPLAYWSSPTVNAITPQYHSINIGSDNEDNAQSINAGAQIVAEYRQSAESPDIAGHHGWEDQYIEWQTILDDETGTYYFKTIDLDNSQISAKKYTANFSAGEIRFDSKVSSEQNFDFLKFYIDNDLQGSWSGEQDWQTVSYSITEGSHSLRWIYEKDGNTTAGTDTAWLRNIHLPLIADLVDQPRSIPSVFGKNIQSASQFYGGVTVASLANYTTQVSKYYRIDANGMIAVEADHIGKQANLLALFTIPGQGYYYADGAKKLEPWQLFNFQQLYVQQAKVLDSVEYLHILRSYLPTVDNLGGKSFNMWFGYELVEEPAVIYFAGEAVELEIRDGY